MWLTSGDVTNIRGCDWHQGLWLTLGYEALVLGRGARYIYIYWISNWRILNTFSFVESTFPLRWLWKIILQQTRSQTACKNSQLDFNKTFFIALWLQLKYRCYNSMYKNRRYKRWHYIIPACENRLKKISLNLQA